ncbi:MAG TPA: alpha/beta hydrolase [Allosphingosinicella sp.]|nr:alpha/beta hydrolase [Allosphingosinicella sp.]
MDIERRAFLGAAAALAAASGAQAQDYKDPALVAADPRAPQWPAKERFPLWPGSPPGAPRTLPRPEAQLYPDPNYPQIWVKGIAVPEVNVFRPALPDGSAILAIPGGGYGFLAVQNEGLHVAERFNADRTTVFVLSYRLPGEGWANRAIVPLSDAQRAMRLIRARATELKIDPSRLGVLGFSAGGHLAADLSVSYDQSVYAPVDAADRISAKPAFSGLIYPVATFQSFTHAGSRDSLLGPNAPPALVHARSPELHVNSATPPSFVVHAFDDGLVPIDNSLAWIAAARAAKTPVEAHLLTEGGHGFGLHLPASNPGSRWPDLFALWMRQHGG